ncbi:hypothetical protein LQE93_09765 [Clostridium sp. NSJ-145]|uniref:hypothetical protein n=1 Tax=Clostridium sp. NSJ-145 TaxID=2897777 RepID=UPI001E52E50D|nr:hypothetical protein [Clostridium sp. NSJ-145]MCD2502066.1 hypothetical protein [Clostridium sp. NSJ-145]
MKKENFVSLIIGTVGLVLFALGMCMAMITEWNTFNQGIVVGTIGIIILIIMLIVRRKMEGKPAIELNKKAIGIVLLGIVGALLLGVGMCMTMVWQGLMVQGIIVGLIGIIILICLIPICKGIK